MRTVPIILCLSLILCFPLHTHAQGWSFPGDLCDNPLIDCWDGQNPGSSANSTFKDYQNGGSGYVLGCMAYYLLYGICNCADFCGEDGDGDGDDDKEPDPGEGDPDEGGTNPDEGGTDPDPDEDDADTESLLPANNSNTKIIIGELKKVKRKKGIYFTKAGKAELRMLRKRLNVKKTGSKIAKIKLSDGSYLVSKLAMKAEYNRKDPYEFINAVIVTRYSASGKVLHKFGITNRVTKAGMTAVYSMR